MFNNKFTKKDPVAEEILKVLESWDDDEDDDVRRADAELKRMKAKPIEADKKTDPDKEIGKLAKKTPKEVDEEVVSEDKWTDIADGPWKKSNRSKSSAASAAANAAGKGLKGAQHKLDVAEPKGKLTGADFKKLRKEDAEQIDELDKKSFLGKIKRGNEAEKKGWASFGKVVSSSVAGDQKSAEKAIRNSNRYYNLTKSGKKGKTAGGFPKSTYSEETSLEEKTLTPAESKKKEEIVKSMKKGVSGFKERYGKRAKEVMYATATKQAKKVAEEIVDEAKGPTSTYGLETNTVESSCTPLSRVKDLARSSMSKIKNEMLGKAGATSEEIDPSVRSTDTLKGRVSGGKTDDVGPKADGKSTKVKFTPGPK